MNFDMQWIGSSIALVVVGASLPQRARATYARAAGTTTNSRSG